MGLIRLLLAIAVVLGHTAQLKGFGFVGGTLAVESFFIISGFYITLILNEKYVSQPNSYWLFISNRALRLYPYYWIILIVSFICGLLIPAYNDHAYIGDLNVFKNNHLSFTTYLFIIFNNIFIFFQDVALFLGINNTGDLYYSHSYLNTAIPAYRFDLVQQAWSIAVELTFYLLAPFIVRNIKLIIGLLLISAFLKLYGAHHGFRDDPWAYRFFPFELKYFLLGAVGYFIYNGYLRNIQIPKAVNIAVWSVLILFTIFYSNLHIPHAPDVYLTAVFFSLPILFKFTKSFKFDRQIGELSYPIYICHILAYNLIRAFGLTLHQNILTVLGSIILSLILNRIIGNNIERLRQGRISNTKPSKILQNQSLSAVQQK